MIYVTLLGFTEAQNILISLKKFLDQTDTAHLDYALVLVDACYPLPSKEENSRNFDAVAELIKPSLYIKLEKNSGQTGNFNEIHKRMSIFLQPDDTIVYWDTDHKMTSREWLRDSIYMRQAGFDFVTCGSVHHIHGKDTNVYELQGQEETLGHIRHRPATWPGGYPIGIFSGRLASWPILQGHDYYGRTEADITEHCTRYKLKTAVIGNWSDDIDRSHFDPRYQAWKQETIAMPHGPDFSTWLEEKKNAVPK